MNYTKGKWKIEQPKSTSLSVLSSDGKPIALLQLRVPPYDDNFEQGCQEMLGNARLISAAPDMYEALKNICNEHSHWVFEELAESLGNTNTRILKDSIEKGRNAIAKAEGK